MNITGLINILKEANEIKEKLYVCGYKHCLLKGEKIKEEDAVMVGTRRFHSQCADVHKKIEQIKSLYFDEIDDKANFVEVVSVINNIIFKKNINPDYMIFALQYVIKKKIRVKSPYSLHYLPKNKIIVNLWTKENRGSSICL